MHSKKARDLLEQSLITYKEHFYKNHVDVAWAEASLGSAYMGLGDYQRAKDLFEKTLASYRKIYGQDHIETARILRNLGHVYLLESHLKKGENLMGLTPDF